MQEGNRVEVDELPRPCLRTGHDTRADVAATQERRHRGAAVGELNAFRRRPGRVLDAPKVFAFSVVIKTVPEKT